MSAHTWVALLRRLERLDRSALHPAVHTGSVPAGRRSGRRAFTVLSNIAVGAPEKIWHRVVGKKG